MSRFVPILLAALLSAGAASAAPAATRTYDCAKAGNATKAVCTGTATTTRKVVKSEKAVARTAAKAATPSKPVVKQATTPSKPVVKQATTTVTPRNFDCTKAGNANKTQCKTSTIRTAVVSKPVAFPRPAPRPAATAVRHAAAAPAGSENRNPAGAIAQCKDGMYSHSTHRDGACARHGGVARWA